MNRLINDTIVALATPAGGAIGVVRLSGPDAIGITAGLFRSVNPNFDLNDAKAGTVHYGRLVDIQGEEVDDVVVSLYRAPHSYTGEDSTEISCHGSAYILQQALHACIDAGARQAAHGEYTQRAYLNGKMDLSQAEAVADLVAANNRATHQLALSQLKGHFSGELTALRDQLLKMTSLVELELDFSDHEELEFADRSDLKELAQRIDDRITTLAHSFEMGNALKKGIPVAIVGKTNVGKSTLLNQLLHEDRAIVSDIDGTTRDVIEDTLNIHDVTFRLIDTAGIRHTSDKVERIGIERAYQKLDEAVIVLWMIDRQPTPEELADLQQRTEGKKVIVLRNKIDIAESQTTSFNYNGFQPFCELAISAKKNIGITELEEHIYAAAYIPELNENSVIVTNARHYEALTLAKTAIEHVLEGLSLDLSGDLLAEDLRICLSDLGEISGGAITSQETLNNIFQHFCVGK